MTKKIEITKGWKVTDAEGKCRNIQFKVGEKYHQTGKIKLCSKGWHFHTQASHLFNYYDFDIKNRVFEIEASGEIVHGDDKSACSDIHFVRELTWNEVLNLINIGQGNTGRNNSGNSNSGYWNSGNSNSGDSNSGYRNSGNSNSGYRNSGYSNSGDSNSGNSNSGNRNSGNSNSGNSNSGNSNSGYWNSGNSNSGNWNSGDWNKSDCNNGMFNTNEQKASLFNGAAFVLMSEFRNTKEYNALCGAELPLNTWISESEMTDQEKIDHPKFYASEGYLKTRTYKEACEIWWTNTSDSNKKLIQQIPGFDKAIFEEITGIKL